jgi:hypothetical protein
MSHSFQYLKTSQINIHHPYTGTTVKETLVHHSKNKFCNQPHRHPGVLCTPYTSKEICVIRMEKKGPKPAEQQQTQWEITLGARKKKKNIGQHAHRKEKVRYHLGSLDLQVLHAAGSLCGADGGVAEGEGGDGAAVLGAVDVFGLGADPG